MKNSEERLFNFEEVRHTLTDATKLKKIFLTVFPYVVIYVVFLLLANRLNITREAVQEYFAGLGGLLIPVFIGIQLLASLTPLPDLPFLAAGILFFRPWASFLLILIGMWLGTIINFFIARKLGRSFMQNHYPETGVWVDRFAGKYGIVTIVAARNFTFVTFDLMAYAAGVSNIGVLKFGIASVLGLIPVALNATLMGLAITSTLETDGLTVGNVARGGAILVITTTMSLGFALVAHRVNLFLESRNS